MARLGSDPEELDQLANQMLSIGGTLSRADSTIGGRLRSTAWSGPDADHFRGWWGRSASPHLRNIEWYMTDIARYLREEASEQRWASEGAGYRTRWGGQPRHWARNLVPSRFRRGPSGNGRYGNSGSGSQGDPVDTATGALWFSETDLTLRALGGLTLPLGRFHHSWFSEDALSFGVGWVSLLDMRVTERDGLVGVLTDEGQFIEFEQDGDSFTVGDEVSAQLERSDAGHVLIDGNGTRFEFDGEGSLSRVTRSGAGEIRFRSGGGRIVAIDGVMGGPLSVEWDDVGRVVAIAGSLVSASFAYDQAGRLVTATNSDGTAEYRWDDEGRIIEQLDRRGRRVVATEYGDDDRVVAQVDAKDLRYVFEWDETTGTATMIDPLGNRWVDRYDDTGVLVERINPLGHGVHFRREGVHVVSVTTPDGVERDPLVPGPGMSDDLDEPDDLGVDGLEADEIETDDDGRVVAVLLDGERLEFSYDDAGRVAAFITTDAVARLSYDADGQIISIDDGDDAVRFVHDDNGLLIEVHGPEGTVRFGYDGEQMVSVALETDGSVTTTFIEDGDLWIEGDGERRRLAEGDDAGRVTAEFDGLDRRTGYEYDEGDRLTAVVAPDGARTTYELDLFDQLERRIDAAGRELRFERDAARRVTAFVTEDGMSMSLDLDAMGRIRGHADGAGRDLLIERNAAGDATTVTGTGIDEQLSYGASGELVAIESAGAGRTDIERDERDFIVALSSGDRAMGYEYDDNGKVTAKIVGDSRIEIVHADGLETSYRGPAGDAALEVGDDPDELTLVLPNGIRSAAIWRDGRLASLRAVGPDGDVVLDEQFSLDAVGNLTTVASSDGGWSYRYDDRDWIVEAVRSGTGAVSLAWAYDAVGARVSQTENGVTTTSTLDDRSRVVELNQSGGASRPLTYDAAGFVVADGDWTFEYDGRGALVRAATDDRTIEHVVDALGNRVRSTERVGDDVVSDVSIVWDLSNELSEPVLATDNLTGHRYLYQYGPMGAPMGVVPLHDPSAARWFVTDALNSVRAVTDAEGRVLGRRTYDPFGRILLEEGDVDTGPLDLGYIGALRDRATGLIHLHAREYDAGLGRFLSPDPVIMPVGMSVVTGYAYAFNRPTVFSDPSGLWPGQGAFNRVKSAASSVAGAARSVGSAVARGTASAVKRTVSGVRAGASWVARGAVAAGDFVWRNRAAIGATLAVVGTVALVVSTGGLGATAVLGLKGAALIKAKTVATVALKAEKALHVADLVHDGSKALQHVRRGEYRAAAAIAAKAGVSFATKRILKKSALKHAYRHVRHYSPDLPVWLARTSIYGVAGAIGGVGAHGVSWVYDRFLDGPVRCGGN